VFLGPLLGGLFQLLTVQQFLGLGAGELLLVTQVALQTPLRRAGRTEHAFLPRILHHHCGFAVRSRAPARVLVSVPNGQLLETCVALAEQQQKHSQETFGAVARAENVRE
jgi:hypothetical protein